MDWKPNKWIAGGTGFFFQSLSMLYVNKVKLALFYFVFVFLLAVLELIVQYKLEQHWLQYFSFIWIVMVFCAVHAYRIADQSDPIINRPWYSRWYSLVSIALVLFSAIFNFRAFLFEPYKMPSSSMFPTIKTNAIIITKKTGYGNYSAFGIPVYKTRVSAPVRRGDILVFQSPENSSIHYVKRIIGLPGDTIKYINKHLIINGKQITLKTVSETTEQEIREEKLGTSLYKINNSKKLPAKDFIITLPAGKYFVLGDNRDNSRDSRVWGFIAGEDLVGKVIHIFQ